MTAGRDPLPSPDARRRRAEARLRHRQAEIAGSPAGAGADPARLLHELQVHQVELEMQNEELRDARAETEAHLARFQELYDFAPTGYVTLDREGAIQRLNLTAAKFLRADRSALANRRLAAFVVAGDRAAFHDLLARVFASTEPQRAELTLAHDAELGPFVRIEGVVAHDGRACSAVIVDLSERHALEARLRAADVETQRLLAMSELARRALLQAAEVEEASAARLRAAERRYRAIFEASPEMLWVVDAESLRFLAVNDAMVAHLGWSREELLGKTLTDIRPAEDRAGLREQLAAQVAGGHVRHATRRYARRDGSVCLMDVWANRVELDGRPVLLGLAVDVTARERDRRRILTLARAVERTPVAIVVTDTDGTIEYVNPGFTRMTGYEAAEALGRTPRILRSGTHDPEFYADLWRTIATGDAWQGAIENRRKDGTLYWTNASISSIADATGQITHYVAVQEDVSARRLLEEEFRQAQKMAAVGQLAGGVAHDFNNELTVMSGYAELARLRTDDGDARAPMLDQVARAARRAASLVQRLLTFGRRRALHPTIVDVGVVVRGILPMLGRLVGDRVVVRTDVATPAALVSADANALEQAVMNLCTNARDAMPDGGTVTIAIAPVDLDAAFAAAHPGARAGRHVRLSVIDAGVGMTAEVRARAFEPFFTTKPPGAGSGLGLSMVHGFATQSGGHVECVSAPGEGTTISVLLPVAAAPVPPPATPTAPPAAGAATILVVDDEPAIVEIARATLGSHGFTVLAADGGDAALRVCAEHPGAIDLLLTDLRMPGMDGVQLAGQVRARHPGVLVVVMSGYAADLVPQEGTLPPPLEFVAKPFTPGELGARVRAVLDAARAAAAGAGATERGARGSPP